MSVARARVVGRFDMASQPQEATITIERAAGLFSVRPLRRRREYTLPLAHVAEWVVRSILMREHREKLAAKKARRKAGRR